MKRYFLYFVIVIGAASCSKSGSSGDNDGSGGPNDPDKPDTIGKSIQLWGMTNLGGANDKGVIFKVNGDGSDFEAAYSFSTSSGYNSFGSLCLAPNGKLYGLTQNGGKNSGGVLFSFDPATKTYKKIQDMGVDFSTFVYYGNPNFNSLMLANDGKLYCAASDLIFRLDPATDTYTKLYDFNITSDGNGVWGGRLIQGNDGKLYGTASSGGASLGGGTVFSYDITASKFTKLHTFQLTDNNGWNPKGSLCMASDGSLYGFYTAMNTSTDIFTLGGIYKLGLPANAYSKVFNCSKEQGYSTAVLNPNLIQVNNNELLGTFTMGGKNNLGLIFSYNFSTSTYHIVHDFNAVDNNGNMPQGGLMKASNGYVYGFCGGGGVLGTSAFLGSIYRFDPVKKSCKMIYGFDISKKSISGYSLNGELVEVKK